MVVKDIKVCVGRWDWFPDEHWDGINSLYHMRGPDIVAEAMKQGKSDPDGWCGVYTLAEFEEEVNGYDPDRRSPLDFAKYWIKIMNKNRKVVS